MKLGLITDIHEEAELLRLALERFANDQVDQVVVIGDVCRIGRHLEETCRLLSDAKAIGVWGNHDLGLCLDPDQETLAKYSATVIDFMASLRPRLEVGGCYFAHVEPWLNPEEIADLWYADGPPDEHQKLDRIFDAVPHRIMFAGHCHQWLLVTPQGIADWSGDTPLALSSAARTFVVVGALCEGWSATYDTETTELVPHFDGDR